MTYTHNRTYFGQVLLVNLIICTVGLVGQSPALGQGAVSAENLILPAGFKAELLYSVPSTEGSWVSLTTDPKGRLIASDQYGKLYRITTLGVEQPVVEQIDLEIGFAQGLLCAFDSLYVVAHGFKSPGKPQKKKPSPAGDTDQQETEAKPKPVNHPAGLYRVQDTDNDDHYDSVQLLRKFEGGGEHGPHAVILSPDKQSLYICGGNHTKLPNPETSRVPRLWQEDQVLPRLPDANGHATGRMAPGGWICKTDPEGKWFELVSVGYRNQYDIAFDPNGELFTYDADMEWDIGLPWYRPTRVCHATSGSEFGWRYGTGKWPSYYPDSLPAVVDIGPGSPTGIVFGTGAKFPAKYQNALFIADWSYGKIYAVHLAADGSTLKGTSEVFCTSAALPVTDLAINPVDGALYFLIGGRRAQSGLYRVTHENAANAEPAEYPAPNQLAQIRRSLEELHGTQVDGAVDKAWPYLSHPDRFIRFAARTAVENQPVKQWIDRALAETDPQSSLEAITALARAGQAEDQVATVNALSRLDWNRLNKMQRLHLLRNVGLVMVRLGEPGDELNSLVNQLGAHYPGGDPELDREFSRVMIAGNADGAIEKTLGLLAESGTQEQQVHFALALSSAKGDWTPEQRQRQLQWFLDAAQLYGGNSFGGYVRNIRKQAVDNMTEDERQSMAEMLARKPEVTDPYADLKARPVVNKWTMENLWPIQDSELQGRDLVNGKKMFALAQCYKCHRISGNGGIVGPDLTPAGRRFNTKDLLVTIIDPDKEISDQYRATKFQMMDGNVIVGRVVNLSGKSITVQPDMIKPNATQRINTDNIDEMEPSSVSMMPAGLLDTLSRNDILDLMAYLKSTSPDNN